MDLDEVAEALSKAMEAADMRDEHVAVRTGLSIWTIRDNGAPIHLTANAVFAAASMAFAGLPASVQSGSMLLAYAPDGSASPTSA